MPGKITGRMNKITLEQIRELALALPKTEEGTSYGTPAFRVSGKLFLRMHEDGESLVVKVHPDDRELRMRAVPETFYITEHYRNYPWMLVRLSTVSPDDLSDLIEEAWRQSAPAKLLATREETMPAARRGGRRLDEPRRRN
jgi:hypothetical protein